MTHEIQLSKGKGVAVIDDEDVDLATQHTWWLHSGGYAYTQRRREGVTRGFYLHQLIARRIGITGTPDHENRNKLDCRRKNLRPCTHTQNMANCGVRKHNKLGVKGVRRQPGRNKYEANITINRKPKFLGTFDTIKEASDAYFKAAQERHGEFASR